MEDWIPKALQTLLELSQLEENWDSYGGKPMRATALGYTLQLLGAFADPYWPVPEPCIVPCSSGAIQLEWEDGDVEVEIGPRKYERQTVAHCLFGEDDEFSVWTLADLCKRLSEVFDGG